MGRDGVVVIGAGAGGLAAAIDLACAGQQVTLVERSDVPGGKIHELEVAGARVDAGPTVLTMRWVFEELFASAGSDLASHVELERSEILARHAWSDRERLDLFADPARTSDAIARLSGVAAARGFDAFRRRAREVYELLEHSFIRASRPSPISLTFRAGGVGKVLRIRPFETLWRELESFFPDPRLQQLFGRYATYCGSSPMLAPATLMLVAHVELEGVWRVAGGMQRLAEALLALAVSRGVKVRMGEAVAEVIVERGRVAGVRLASGERLDAARVVVNADASALGAGLLGQAVRGAVPAVPVEARSLSALTVAVHARTRGFPLVRHNVFFGTDYAQEFRDALERRRLPRSPTVYVCAQDRGDGDASPTDPERLFLIVNAPPTGDVAPPTREEVDTCVERAFALLRSCGLEVERTEENVRVSSPSDFERRFPATGGALYGRATHGSMASFQRPAARTRIPGLYLAGGSVHPGPGVPMAALSGRIAAREVLEDVPARSRVTVPALPAPDHS